MTDELVEIRLLELSIPAQLQASEHHDELFREFALIAARTPSEGHAVPVRLSRLIDELQTRFAGFTDATNRELEDAIAEGRPSVDLVFRVPPVVRQACLDLAALLDEAEAYCREGDLLTLAPPRESVAYRDWFLGEFVRQVDGEQPLPWPDYAATQTA